MAKPRMLPAQGRPVAVERNGSTSVSAVTPSLPTPPPPVIPPPAKGSGRADGVRVKFNKVRAELSAALIERESEIDLALLALVSGEHLLLVGPPGVAKSLLLDSLCGWLEDAKRFSIVMNKFTMPDEVFGPLSLSGLRADKCVRVTAGKLPEAHLAFLDEVFKANSAILNTLLPILNERAFDFKGDGNPTSTPLRLCVAASNEWPQGEDLSALFDRFLLRKVVNPVRSRAGEERLWFADSLVPALSEQISGVELDVASKEALALPWSEEGKEAFREINRRLRAEGVLPSNRRQRKAVKVCQASAWLDGFECVQAQHLEPICHCLWDVPGEQQKKVLQVVNEVAKPVGLQVVKHLEEVEEILAAVFSVKDYPSKMAKAKAFAGAAAKLEEIGSRLTPMKGQPRADQARRHIWESLKELKQLAADAI